ncbi:uncharacterized protein BXZ73DRAFT_1162, partial [Epithele typhae]|uniref:uncharacterized protein n=1 Tax=Epithele typhae TaxID=378194 RepID=UPI00200828CF
SDGEGALREVEAKEAEKAEARGQQRGPKNRSVVHWSVARPTTSIDKGLRWTFTCRHCGVGRSFRRTLTGDNVVWEDEPVKPPLANLASHLKQAHPELRDVKHRANAAARSSKDGSFYDREDVEAFEGYMHSGPFDPNSTPTQQGFTAVIAGWLLYEDLPFTTAEATSFKSLMRYCQVRFLLPSDKTVRAEVKLGIMHLIALTGDNVAANDLLAAELMRLLIERYDGEVHFHPDNGRIHCFAHVVNLVVQKVIHDLLKASSSPAEVENLQFADPDVKDYYEELHKHLPFHYD